MADVKILSISFHVRKWVISSVKSLISATSLQFFLFVIIQAPLLSVAGFFCSFACLFLKQKLVISALRALIYSWLIKKVQYQGQRA